MRSAALVVMWEKLTSILPVPITVRKRRPGPVQQRLAALIFGCLLLGVAEAVLRLGGYAYTREEVVFRFVGPDLLNAPQFVRDRRLFWRLRPGAQEVAAPRSGVTTNEAGFRGPLVPRGRRPGVPRVACMGDSSTYGVSVTFHETYVARLGRRLEEERGRPVEVIDAGCPGYSSYQGLGLLQDEILAFRPDAVTLFFGAWNDFVPAIGGDDAEKAQRANVPEWLDRAHGQVARFRLFMAISQAVDWLAGRKSDAEFGRRTAEAYVRAFKEGRLLEGPRVSPVQFRANLVGMIQLCRAHGIEPVLISPPLSPGAQRDYPVYRTYRAMVASVAREEDVQLVAAAEELDRLEAAGEPVFGDWVHPSAKGHEVIAGLLAPVVGRILSLRGDGAPGAL